MTEITILVLVMCVLGIVCLGFLAWLLLSEDRKVDKSFDENERMRRFMKKYQKYVDEDKNNTSSFSN